MLKVYPSQVQISQITHQLFKRLRALKWIAFQQLQQILGFGLQTRFGKLPRILERVFGKYQMPTHQFNSVAAEASGSAIPAMIDSRIPGTDSRNKVSWIATQSSLETRTALVFFPQITIG